MPKLLIKIALFLAGVAGLTWLGAWMRNLEGVTVVEWGGAEYAVGTSTAVIGLFIGFVVLWAIFYVARKGVKGVLKTFDFLSMRRNKRGLKALSRAMIALSEGDGQTASREAQRAERLLENPDLTRLVNAQAAALVGDERLAEKYYEAMAEDQDTNFIGLRGMLGQALKEKKTERALRLAERAHALRPKQGEILQTMFDLQRRKGDWSGARTSIDASVRAKRLTRDVGDRRRAVLHLSDAQAQEAAGDRQSALKEALAAVRLAPGLSPAAAMAARLLAGEGEKRAATRILMNAWKLEPHPDLARTFATFEPDETAEDRAKRFERLVMKNADHSESKLLRAELAVAAKDFSTAREALGDMPTNAPSARACALMAAIEQGQGGADTAVRGWLSRAAAAPRGAQWACDACGAAASQWTASCNHCDAFDSLSWKQVESPEILRDRSLFPLLRASETPNLARSLTADAEAPADAFDAQPPLAVAAPDTYEPGQDGASQTSSFPAKPALEGEVKEAKTSQ